MKVLILGASQVGTSIAEVLVSESNDVTVVDIDQRALQLLQNRLDIRTVAGNAAYPSVLKRAGAEDADIVLAVTNNDEVNLVASQIAQNYFLTPTRVARLRSREYLDNPDLIGKGKSFEIDVVISPEMIVSNHISRLIEFPGALQVLDFADGMVQLVAVRALAGGPLLNCELSELRQHLPKIETRVAAIYRDQKIITPRSDTVIQEDDEVFFVAPREHIKYVMREMRGRIKKNRRVMIAGGGNIGLSLAQDLESKGYSVKVIEIDPERAATIADQVASAYVLNGDAADANLLEQENINGVDVFCAVTEKDEINILTANLAKSLGAERVMALVNRPAYLDHLDHSNINNIIAPRLVTIGAVSAHMRRVHVVAVHSLRRGKAEALEAVAHGNRKYSKVIGRGVRELELPEGTGIGAIVRDEDVIIPDKNTVIEAEDHVILFIDDKSRTSEVEALFNVDSTFV